MPPTLKENRETMLKLTYASHKLRVKHATQQTIHLENSVAATQFYHRPIRGRPPHRNQPKVAGMAQAAFVRATPAVKFFSGVNYDKSGFLPIHG